MSQTFPVQEPIDKYGNPKEWKKMKLDKIRLENSQLIKDLGISPLDFNMKMPFYDRHGRYVIGVFASEFKKEKGFFFELVDRDLEPIDENRTVYRIARNDNFEEEYEMSEKGSYLVLVDELRMINPDAVAVSKDGILSNDKIFSSAPVPAKPQPVQPAAPVPPPVPGGIATDAPYGEMTIRDYYAIHSGKPVSLKSWLNDLIRTNK